MEMNYWFPPLRNSCWYADALKPGEIFWKYYSFTHNHDSEPDPQTQWSNWDRLCPPSELSAHEIKFLLVSSGESVLKMGDMAQFGEGDMWDWKWVIWPSLIWETDKMGVLKMNLPSGFIFKYTFFKINILFIENVGNIGHLEMKHTHYLSTQRQHFFIFIVFSSSI